MYKYQFYGGQRLNVRGKNVKYFEKKRENYFLKEKFIDFKILILENRKDKIV